MPARPTRRRSDPNAGPAITDERTAPPEPRAPEQPGDRSGAVIARLADRLVTEKLKPRKFTALLDGPTDARFGRLLDALRESAGPVATRSDGNGRTRAGYDLSRADLLRALLEVAEDDPSVMTDVLAKVQYHYGATS